VAIGIDNRLITKMPGPKKSPLSPSRQGPTSTPYPAPPPMISDRAVQSATNNMTAQSAGAGQMAMKEMDRAGISRGKGQEASAERAQAMADVQARVGAARAEMGAASANANAMNDYRNQMQAQRLQSEGLLEGLRSSQEMARIQRRGIADQQAQARQRGQLGLDQMYLDFSPFVGAFFR
jgi:hypothetical protein